MKTVKKRFTQNNGETKIQNQSFRLIKIRILQTKKTVENLIKSNLILLQKKTGKKFSLIK